MKRFMWVQVVTGMLLMITSLGFARLAYGVIMPFMRQGLSLTYAQSGMLSTATSLGYLSTVALAGILSLRLGNRRVILLGGCAIVASLAGLSFVATLGWAMGLMFLAGMGTALTFTPLVSLMVAWFPAQKGLVLGCMLSGVGIATLATGIAVPAMVRHFPGWGWRAAWALFGTVSLAVLAIAAVILKNPPGTAPLTPGRRPARDPLAQSVYRKKEVLNIAFLYFCIGVSYLVPTIFQMGFMLDRHISAPLAGQIVALGGVLSVPSGPAWGYFSDRVGRRATLLLSMCLVIVGMAIPAAVPRLPGFLASQILLGSTVNGMMSQIQVSATEQVPPHLSAVSLGYVTLFFAAGQLLGPGIAGWIIDHLGGFHVAYLFSVLLTVTGLIFALRVKPGPTPHQKSVTISS
jgi:MFS family permease